MRPWAAVTRRCRRWRRRGGALVAERRRRAGVRLRAGCWFGRPACPDVERLWRRGLLHGASAAAEERATAMSADYSRSWNPGGRARVLEDED